jgi:hypothetical protein
MDRRRTGISPLSARAAALALITVLLAGLAPRSAPAAEVSGCVGCHLDAATLKSLTPADPPPSEAGEG